MGRPVLTGQRAVITYTRLFQANRKGTRSRSSASLSKVLLSNQQQPSLQQQLFPQQQLQQRLLLQQQLLSQQQQQQLFPPLSPPQQQQIRRIRMMIHQQPPQPPFPQHILDFTSLSGLRIPAPAPTRPPVSALEPIPEALICCILCSRVWRGYSIQEREKQKFSHGEHR